MRWIRGSWLALSLVAGGCAPIDLGVFSPQPKALSRVVPEPPGAACAQGGQAVRTGLDVNGDDTLGDDEVTSTEYLCAGTVLVRTETLAPGDACPTGGQVTKAGQDLDGDGVLADAEVTRELTACTRVAPVLTRLRPVSWTPSCSSGATLLEAGEDVDGNGTLGDAEVQASYGFCMVDSTRVRSAVHPEPAGGRCGQAGARVDAWPDMNDDGQRQPDTEPLTTLTVCQPTRVHDGDYLVGSAADLAALQGVTRVDGDLVITSETLDVLGLPELVVVMGVVRVTNNPRLAHVSLPHLRFARSVELQQNPALETVSIGRMGGPPVFVDEDVVVDDAPKLASLEGLTPLNPRRHLRVLNLPQLQTLSFPHITHLSANLTVQGNDALRSMSLPNLVFATNVWVTHNAALESLSGLATLQSADQLLIAALPALTSLSGLDGLTFLRDLIVAECAGLKAVTIPHLTRVEQLGIQDNPSLESVSGMPRLQVSWLMRLSGNAVLHELKDLSSISAMHTLDISRNPALKDLSALGRLVRLEQLGVYQNILLEDLSGLAGLQEVASLTVAHNPALRNLGMEALVSTTEFFDVRSNPLLPTCQAQRLADRVHTGAPPSRLIDGNDDQATCPNP